MKKARLLGSVADSTLGAPPPRDLHSHARELECGGLLVFPKTPFAFPQADQNFLLNQKQSAGRHHKNIAYRPAEDRITGQADGAAADTERLRAIMRDYSRRATEFLANLLPAYATSWRLDFASFRPQQEKGRQVRQRARNDLLHIDSFPTRPTNGDLILRLFTNINPSEPRCWITSEPFEALVKKYAGSPGFPRLEPLSAESWRRVGRLLGRWAHSAGLPIVPRSPYDRFMLEFHHFLKENEEFQATCPKQHWNFPPGSTWIVLTDVVPHAALSGQFALEQTYLVARESLVLEDRCPASVLERLCGGKLTHPDFARGPSRSAA